MRENWRRDYGHGVWLSDKMAKIFRKKDSEDKKVAFISLIQKVSFNSSFEFQKSYDKFSLTCILETT